MTVHWISLTIIMSNNDHNNINDNNDKNINSDFVLSKEEY